MLLEGKIEEKFRLWTESEYFDLETKTELLEIKDQKEIEDRFYTDLEFGTGGMRGVMGSGTNRMNKYVIRKLSQGLADTIREEGSEDCSRGVVIAYDCRRNSAEFALETALVLAANNIKAFLFDALRPTPELSFAVRFLHAIAGVNITASHNPKEYNGYKVYWEDGGQIPPAKAKQIVDKIAERTSWMVQPLDQDEARERGLLLSVGREIDQAFLQVIKNQLLYPGFARDFGNKLKIVYTPLHGAGNKPVRQVLEEIGFTSLFIVPEQENPDCEFSTIKLPNPEDPLAFEMALSYASEQQADIVLATDPDADRLGLYAKDEKGSYQRFTGNQIGVLLEYYLLSQKKRLGKLPEDVTVVKTIASTDLGDSVARYFGARTINVLVGFKYIGEQIKQMEENGSGTFLFGFEESHGYLAGTYARDKDAVEAAALLAEAALYYLEKENKTLPEVLEEVFKLCGYYLDEQYALTLQGREGKDNINRIIDLFRTSEQRVYGGLRVISIDDFLTKMSYFPKEGLKKEMGQPELPQENVIRLRFEGGGFVIIRPSGTEPKIRFYFCIKGESSQEIRYTLEKVKTDVLNLIQVYLPQNV